MSEAEALQEALAAVWSGADIDDARAVLDHLRDQGADEPGTDDAVLPWAVLTYRRGANGNEILDAIPLDAEWHAHDVATALANTGQPTFLLDLDGADGPTIERYVGDVARVAHVEQVSTVCHDCAIAARVEGVANQWGAGE